MPQHSKSPVLRVASDAPREQTMAAICASACAMGVPGPAGGRDTREQARRISVERKDASGEILLEHPLGFGLQSHAPLPLWHDFQTVQDFSLADRRNK